MIGFPAFLLKLLFCLFRSKKHLVSEVALLRKELEILKRRTSGKQIMIRHSDRIFLVALNKASGIRERISIVKPETVIRWQRMLIKHFWTFRTCGRKKGRKPVDKQIQDLILGMKNENNTWGVRKIQGELMKLNIFLDSKTIWNILHKFRLQGRIKTGLTWKKFLQMQAHSICGMDFFTVDTIFNKRYYVFFMIAHTSREIVRFAVTENPVREFVRQQIIEFEQGLKRTMYLIHDNAVQFKLRYRDYGFTGIAILVGAPDMNAIAERFIGSIRREAQILQHSKTASRP
jgi:hypothetical protein